MGTQVRNVVSIFLCLLMIWTPLAPLAAETSVSGQASIEANVDLLTQNAAGSLLAEPELNASIKTTISNIQAEQARLSSLAAELKSLKDEGKFTEAGERADEIISVLLTAKLADTLARAAGRGTYFIQSLLTTLAHDGIDLYELKQLIGRTSELPKKVSVPFPADLVETANHFLKSFIDSRSRVSLADIMIYETAPGTPWPNDYVPTGPAKIEYKEVAGVRNFIIPFLSFFSAFLGGFVMVTDPQGEMMNAIWNALSQTQKFAGEAAVGGIAALGLYRGFMITGVEDKIERALKKFSVFRSEGGEETAEKFAEGLPLFLGQSLFVAALTVGVVRNYSVDSLHVMLPSLFVGLAAWLLEWQFSAFSRALWAKYFWNGRVLDFKPVNFIPPLGRGVMINVAVNVSYSLILALFSFAGAHVSMALSGSTGWVPSNLEAYTDFPFELAWWSAAAFVASFGLPQILVSMLKDSRIVSEKFRYILESLSVFFNGALGRILSIAIPSSLAITIAGKSADVNVGVAIMAAHFALVSAPIAAYFVGRRMIDGVRSQYRNQVLSRGGNGPVMGTAVGLYRTLNWGVQKTWHGSLAVIGKCGRILAGTKKGASAPTP